MPKSTAGRITNTATARREQVEAAHEWGVPVGAFVAPGSIEAEEAAGQMQVVFSDLLPTARGGDEKYVALGFTFGDPVEGDELFQHASLPDGWTREGSGHAMHSYILDADGYRRVNIFYKAAFYDRRADMHIEAVPQTAGQREVANALAARGAELDAGLLVQNVNRREGPDVVYAYRGRYGDSAPAGKHAYSDDGRRLEVIVAPDGSIVERRDFTVEPEGDRW